MLAKNINEKLFEVFSGLSSEKLNESILGLESLQENFAFEEEDFEYNIAGKSCDSAVAYIDISSFSQKIHNWEIERINSYLQGYYNKIFPIIRKYNGHIDKIMGDGIIVVFSNIFEDNAITDLRSAITSCFDCCKECVMTCYETEYELKAAIGYGKLLFCKTGVESVYEEATCIGHPLTVAYRLENIAEKNQILAICKKSVLANSANDVNVTINDSGWEKEIKLCDLRGVGNMNVCVLTYHKPDLLDDFLRDYLCR